MADRAARTTGNYKLGNGWIYLAEAIILIACAAGVIAGSPVSRCGGIEAGALTCISGHSEPADGSREPNDPEVLLTRGMAITRLIS